tara:strand:+ start:34183 stop:35517 length:1335 start_codon:yes stop_codon:yes gene_type:complete
MTVSAFPPLSQSHQPPASAEVYIRLGVFVIAAVFGGLALWSVLAPIHGAIVAPGQIVVESNRKAVQHLEGGVVSDILVEEGDLVTAGDIVVRLEDVTQRADLALIDGQLTELYARRARLEAERDGAPMIADPRGIAEVIGLAGFHAKTAGQKQLFDARRTTRDTQSDLLQERIVQQNERIAGLNAQIDSLQKQRRLIEDELEGIRDLNKRGYATINRVRELERESTRLAGERGALRASVAEAQSIIAEAKLEIERLNETGREDAISELRDAEVSIADLEERRVAAADALRRTEIRAPYSGRVLGLSIHTVGGVIAPGAPIMEIVPDSDRLMVAARIAPGDVDKVQAGQETLVRFSAFGSRRTPEVNGRVKTVSADSLLDDRLGAPYYLVLVEIPEHEALDSILQGAELAPGMPVEAFIRTGSKPAITYLLKPLSDSMSRSMREE